MKPQAIIFDLDGTLLNSTLDLAAAANAARATLGHPPLPPAEVEGGIGRGLGHLLRHVLPVADHPRLPELRAAFIAAYQAAPLVHGGPYPGAQGVLDAWPAAKLGLVTNKPRVFLDPILDRLGWADAFGAVVAGDDLAQRKPDPAPLVEALGQLGAPPAGAVFVGDSEVDQETAARAGVRFLAVPWGRVSGDAGEVLAGLGDLQPEAWA